MTTCKDSRLVALLRIGTAPRYSILYFTGLDLIIFRLDLYFVFTSTLLSRVPCGEELLPPPLRRSPLNRGDVDVSVMALNETDGGDDVGESLKSIRSWCTDIRRTFSSCSLLRSRRRTIAAKPSSALLLRPPPRGPPNSILPRSTEELNDLVDWDRLSMEINFSLRSMVRSAIVLRDVNLSVLLLSESEWKGLSLSSSRMVLLQKWIYHYVTS